MPDFFLAPFDSPLCGWQGGARRARDDHFQGENKKDRILSENVAKPPALLPKKEEKKEREIECANISEDVKHNEKKKKKNTHTHIHKI